MVLASFRSRLQHPDLEAATLCRKPPVSECCHDSKGFRNNTLRLFHLGIWSWQCSSCNSHGAHPGLGKKKYLVQDESFPSKSPRLVNFTPSKIAAIPVFCIAKHERKTFIFFNNHVFCGRWEWSPTIKISVHVWRLSFWIVICCELQCFQESPLFKVIGMKSLQPGCHSTPGLYFFKAGIPTKTFICHGNPGRGGGRSKPFQLQPFFMFGIRLGFFCLFALHPGGSTWS